MCVVIHQNVELINVRRYYACTDMAIAAATTASLAVIKTIKMNVIPRIFQNSAYVFRPFFIFPILIKSYSLSTHIFIANSWHSVAWPLHKTPTRRINLSADGQTWCLMRTAHFELPCYWNFILIYFSWHNKSPTSLSTETTIFKVLRWMATQLKLNFIHFIFILKQEQVFIHLRNNSKKPLFGASLCASQPHSFNCCLFSLCVRMPLETTFLPQP